MTLWTFIHWDLFKSSVLQNSLIHRKTDLNYGYDVSYIKGAKTGFTYDAGKCLASIAIDSKNNIEYLLVTTNADISTKDAYHIKDAVNVYNYYFENYKYHNLINKGDLIVTLPTKYGKEENINIYAEEDITYYLDNSFNKDNVTLQYNGINEITTNMEEGTKLGYININRFNIY